jgi:hypothetical protein
MHELFRKLSFELVNEPFLMFKERWLTSTIFFFPVESSSITPLSESRHQKTEQFHRL